VDGKQVGRQSSPGPQSVSSSVPPVQLPEPSHVSPVVQGHRSVQAVPGAEKVIVHPPDPSHTLAASQSPGVHE
jgi:hypothetical protein